MRHRGASAAAARGALIALAALLALPARARAAAADAPAPADSTARRASPADPIPDADYGAAAEGRVIREVRIIRRPVFDPDSGSRLAPYEHFGNRLHIMTRRGTVERQLLFGPGDRWSVARAQETARKLRALEYLDPLRVGATVERDSAVAEVVTRDMWTFTPRFDVASADGHGVGTIGINDRNAFGYGKSLSVFYRNDTNGKSWNFAYDDPNLGGGHGRLHYAAGRGTEGATDQIAAGLPFYAQQSLRAYEGGWSRSTFVTHLFSSGVEVANFDERSERVTTWYGGRLSGGPTIRRLIGSFELWDRRLGPSRLAPGAPPEFAGDEENIKIRRFNGEIDLWRPGYVERRNIDRFERIEDFDLGTQLQLKAGYAPAALGSSQDEGYARITLDLGVDTPLGFGWLASTGSSRFAPQSIERIAEMDARWYTRIHSVHTLALGAYGISGTNTPRDFQARTGGLDGLRAYPIDAVAGQKLWRLNAEERWLWSPTRWRVARFGSATFFDAARAWGVGAEGTSWFYNAGVGLRVGVRTWGLRDVMRVDVAWPIQPTRDGGHAAVLTFGSSQAF